MVTWARGNILAGRVPGRSRYVPLLIPGAKPALRRQADKGGLAHRVGRSGPKVVYPCRADFGGNGRQMNDVRQRLWGGQMGWL